MIRNWHSRCRRAAALAALTVLPALMLATRAVPAGAAQSGAEYLEEIRVTAAGRRSQGLADVNGAVSVLDSAELQLVSHSHYQEALNRLPGVSGHRNNGQESLAAIRSPVLTGAGACGSFLVAENGIPVRSQGFCNVNEMFDSHSENAQRIEVVRGPASALFGSNAVHGLINVVLPEAGDAGAVTLEAGPRGSSRGKARLGKDYGEFSQLLLLTGTRENGYRQDSGVDQQKLSWLYRYAPAGGAALDGGVTVANLNQETAGFVVGPEAYKGESRVGNPNPEAYRDSRAVRAWTAARGAVGDWRIAVTPYARAIAMEFVQHFLPGQPIEDTEQRSLGTQALAYREVGAGGTLALGVDLEATTGSLLQYQPQPTRGSRFLVATIPQGRHYDYEVRARQLGTFLSYDGALGDDWEVSAGLRFERVSYDYDNRMLTGRTNDAGLPCGFGGCRYHRPADRRDGFSNLSPKFGLSYAVSAGHRLQLRAQRGFRAPQATELYRLQNAQQVADLESVALDSVELALAGAGDSWDYNASLYVMDKENGIIANSARENLNGSHTAHRGFELDWGVGLGDGWTLRGVFNIARHTYENSRLSGGLDIEGNLVDTAPETFGNLRLGWRPNPRLGAELEWARMGDYFTNPENTASYPGHDLVNLRVWHDVSERLRIALNLLNVLDAEYAERADWTSFSGDRYFPGEPLRAHLALTWRWR